MAAILESERETVDILPFDLIMEADAQDIRLENIGGLTVWEAMPLGIHQVNSFRIQSSVRPSGHPGHRCACFHMADVVVRFPDGSKKRPDIAIWCSEPEMETEVTLIPEAVIEILSKGYEKKDLEVGVPFYLDQKVADVIVFDPYSGDVQHY